MNTENSDVFIGNTITLLAVKCAVYEISVLNGGGYINNRDNDLKVEVAIVGQ